MRWFGKREQDDVEGDPNAGPLATAVEGMLANVPAPRSRALGDPASEAARIARHAARRAAVLSGSLALPPGPLGLITVLPDIYLIWRVQRQMVADIFSVYGRTAELTSTHMAFCLFRHLASHVVKDAVVRAGERLVVRKLSRGALQRALAPVGGHLLPRVIGSSASRWLPIAGAVAVAAYAYWDTMQVARAAHRLLDREPEPSTTAIDAVAPG
jgi:hypothetical protein